MPLVDEPAGAPPPLSPAGGLLAALGRRAAAEWRAIDDDGARERALLQARGGPDLRPAWVLVLVTIILVAEQYWGDTTTFYRLWPAADGTRWGSLGEHAWWSGAKLVGYLLVPALVARLAGMRLADLGLSRAGMTRHLRLYAALFALVLPLVVVASTTRAFQDTYPFYKQAARSWTDLLAWEAMYGATFLAVEFFFRGFMLFALRRAFGASAIFVMIIPYTMVHFTKPPAEVFGAIAAGVVLGALALRTRSIWCGVLIHVSVAWSMDLLALWHTTGFPGSGRYVGP